MSYVESNLLPGETVQYRAHLHPIVFGNAIILGAFAVVFIIVAIVGAVASASGRGAAEPGAAGVFETVAGLFIVLAVGAWLAALINLRTSEFVVTSRRVMIKVGWLDRRSLEIVLPKVEGIGVDQPLLGRMFDFGTIVVRGTGGTHEGFHNIAAPLEFRKQVQSRLPES